MRHAPPVPGQPSEFYSSYFKQLMGLVETAASRKRQHKKVILFGHSLGGNAALEFVRNTPAAWRNKYIKHLFLAAPTLSEGFLGPLKNLASGPDMLPVPKATTLSLRQMWRSFDTAIMYLPSPKVFGHKPLVVTKKRNYSAYDLEDLLTVIGFKEGIEPFRKRGLPQMHNFQAPMVPVTCINGAGIRTAETLVHWESDFDSPPELVYGDGDGMINLIGMLAFDEKFRRQPGQSKLFKSIKLEKAGHKTIVTDEWMLKRIIQEILEVNTISS